METPAKPGWISVALTARKLQKSPRQIWRLVASGELPSELVDGKRLVSRAAVEAKKPVTCQSQCHSDTAYDLVVEQVMEQLRPEIEQAVRAILQSKEGR